MNLAKVTKVGEKACFDIAGNRIALGGLTDIKVGSYVAYREQVVTQRTDAATGNLVDLEPLAYWTNKIATAVFSDRAAGILALSEGSLMAAEASLLVKAEAAKLAQNYEIPASVLESLGM